MAHSHPSIPAEEQEPLNALRHSCAHLLAAAVCKLFPGTKPTIGPAIDSGFYYDFEFENPITEEDLPRLEAAMHDIVKEWESFQRHEVSAEEALSEFSGNPYKQELINEFSQEGEALTIYQSGSFRDLCRGGHCEHPSHELKHFTLLSIAGAYWRGNEKNTMLTRIYGTAFPTAEALEQHLTLLEEVKLRDHRKLGREMELFTFDADIGPGLPLWLPYGNTVKAALEEWAIETEKAWGYVRVSTPVITKENLFFTSGHLPLYADSMYSPMDIDGEKYYIKPMNCPFHHKIFSSRLRSYRELPLRVAEYGLCHRYEDSGALFGLLRVRSMDMNDAHIYCAEENAVEEFVQVIKLHEYYYKLLGIEQYRMDLSLRDPKKMDKYHGDEETWKKAEEMTIQAMEQSGVPFHIVNEGAAFYGPKMDFQIFSSIGREFSASTNQLDLYMGKRFGLEYAAADGSKKTPAIIHRAPLGTHERFIGFLIEHFGGNFPLWLAPVQARILPIVSDVLGYAEELEALFAAQNIRVEVDRSDTTLGNKIRSAQPMRIPYLLIVGKQEAEERTVSLRIRGGGEEKGVSIDALQLRLKERITTKARDL